MKLARLVCAVLALTLISSFSAAEACEKHKAAAATAAAKAPAATAAANGAMCTPEMAAACPPEMMAACKAAIAAGHPDPCKGAAAAAAVAAASNHCNSAAGVTASAKGASRVKATKATSAAVAAGAGCCAASKASAATAASSGARASKGVVMLAGSGGACASKASKAATAASRCTDHGMSSMAAVNAHDDCEACLDMADCSGALDAAGAHRQMIRLKNGIMYVYTADSPRSVSAVQAAVARRVDHMAQFATAGTKVHLCDECKAMRGAMASGKLVREVVNIEGGTLTLVTSSDPKLVEKIHALTSESKTAARAKI